jgi:hypothetical protein
MSTVGMVTGVDPEGEFNAAVFALTAARAFWKSLQAIR